MYVFPLHPNNGIENYKMSLLKSDSEQIGLENCEKWILYIS